MVGRAGSGGGFRPGLGSSGLFAVSVRHVVPAARLGSIAGSAAPWSSRGGGHITSWCVGFSVFSAPARVLCAWSARCEGTGLRSGHGRPEREVDPAARVPREGLARPLAELPPWRRRHCCRPAWGRAGREGREGRGHNNHDSRSLANSHSSFPYFFMVRLLLLRPRYCRRRRCRRCPRRRRPPRCCWCCGGAERRATGRPTDRPRRWWRRRKGG